jgi:hypothetical protein
LFANSGIARELTRNPEHFGISNFDASVAGVVVADPVGGGVDQLAKLIAGGSTMPLNSGNGGHALAGAISGSGRIAFLTAPYKGSTWRIGLKDSFSAVPTWIYASASKSLSGPSQPSFGPGSLLAIVDPSQGSDPPPRVLTRGSNGWRPVRSSVVNANSIVMSPRGNAALLTTNGNRSCVLNTVTGTVLWLPRGWFGMAWSPNGVQIIAAKGSELGLAQGSDPGAVDLIGKFEAGFGAAQIVWLARPAKL